MLYALLNNDKVSPLPGQRGTCPCCENEMFAKCGEIYAWHWAHKKGESCDVWYEPETDWHYNWKISFGKDNCEVVIRKDGKRHIADIFTKEEVVIELQNSSIQRPVIREREEFYGEKMLWVINGLHFEDNFSVRKNEDYNAFKNGTYQRRYSWEEKEQFPYWFSWTRPRRSWENVTRPVFIDFGKEDLFFVKRRMGHNYGEGTWISKKVFFLKYGGDYTLFLELQAKSKEKLRSRYDS